MASEAIDVAEVGLFAGEAPGPLEQRHLEYANYRAVAEGSKLTRTHWHIALANGLGWGFDGMDGVIFQLVSPLIIKEFALDIPTFRTGFQIWLTLGITGLYFWPWLSDRVGRRTLLTVNIAMFSLMMPIVALAPSFAVFVAARALITFALNGEWSLGSMLVAETWPAHLRGRVISINRATWCFGASFAGAIAGLVAGTWGWRTAVMVPGVIALFAIYVRATCPESPTGYALRIGSGASPTPSPPGAPERRGPGLAHQGRQGWHPAGLYAGCAAGHVGRDLRRLLQLLHLWHSRGVDAALPLHREALVDGGVQHFLRFLGLVGFFGLCVAGWLSDKIGRRVGFIALLIWGAVFMTLWVYAASNLWLWIFGLAWSFGFLGFWARARRSPPRFFLPAFVVWPMGSYGSSASLSDLCCGRSQPSLCNRQRDPLRWLS